MDGKGRDVRLQHPLGVAWNKADGKLYLVDSYNHKVAKLYGIKSILMAIVIAAD